MQKGVRVVTSKTDTVMIKVLEIIALLGEATADEIQSFLNGPLYAEN